MKQYKELLSNLGSNTLVLTVNRRLTQYLKNQHAKLQATPVWETPNIHPLQTWMIQHGQHCQQNKILLNDFQENYVWQKIIRDQTQAQPIIQLRNTAALAKQAWQLMHHWQLSTNDLHLHANDETTTFINWIHAFQKKLDAHNWVTTAELIKTPPQIPQHIKTIYLVGFDDIAPAIHTLLDHYQKKGVHVTQLTSSHPTPKTQRFSMTTKENELLTMAKWAETQIKENPHQKIACLIPNLAQIRDQVESTFNKACSQPFNLSAGRALSDYPAIQAALNLLELNLQEIEFPALSRALMSIYHNENAADRCCAAKTESELRLYSSARLTPDNILHECQRQAKKFEKSTLGERWKTYTTLKLSTLEKVLLPSEWITPFQNILFGIGWPSSRPLNSENFQVIQRWQNLWEDFSSLDHICGSLSYFSAVNLLKQLAQQTVFQKKSTPAQIQIMGLLESSGLYFDQIWLAGLDDESWPPRAKPNPFIPYPLQREHKMPHASSERELHYCQTLQERLMRFCKQLNVSHPTEDDDKTLHPSSLIKFIPASNINELDLPSHLSEAKKQLQLNLPVEKIRDEKGPALQPEEITYGGSWILQQQALCPFRAFSKIRLHADAPALPTLGLNAAQRGTLTHAVLENCWKALKNQKTLLSLNANELSTLIDQQINHAISLMDDFEKDFIAVEKQRLHELLLAWFELEKTRPDFSVREQETTRFIKIGHLKLRITIDRIDELDKNALFVIDYKTGKSNPLSHWLNESLTQPQLPLYALYGTEQAVGISYAQVNIANMQFTGLIAEGAASLAFSKIKTAEKADPLKRSWKNLNDDWKNTLTQLSHDFCQGVAQIKPSLQACLHCDLHAFCRIGITNE